MEQMRKYIVVLPDGRKAVYEDYNAAKRHAQIICMGTKRKPQITIKTKFSNEIVEV